MKETLDYGDPNKIEYGDIVKIVKASCGCCGDFIGREGKVIMNALEKRVEVEGLGYSTFKVSDLKLLRKTPRKVLHISIPRYKVDPHLYTKEQLAKFQAKESV